MRRRGRSRSATERPFGTFGRAGSSTPSAGQRLRASIRRLGASLRPRGPHPDAPEPGTPWEHATDQRLAGIEKQLNNQNRLLLITVITIVADTAYKFAVRQFP